MSSCYNLLWIQYIAIYWSNYIQCLYRKWSGKEHGEFMCWHTASLTDSLGTRLATFDMWPWLPSYIVEVEKSQISMPLQVLQVWPQSLYSNILMQLYQDTLEAPLLLLVSSHCQQYSSQLLAQDDYSAYLLQVMFRNKLTLVCISVCC